MKMFKALFFISFVSILVACQTKAVNPAKAAKLEDIDSLLVVTRYLQEKMLSADTTALQRDYPKIDSVYKIIVTQYPDKQDKRFWVEEVNNLELIRGSYQKFLRDQKEIIAKLDKMEAQLTALRNSVEDDQLSAEEQEQYLVEESRILSGIRLLVRKRQPNMETAVEMWRLQQSHFDSIAQSLQQSSGGARSESL